MEDDDPFDFKIGVEKNALNSGKKTTTEAMMKSMMMKPSSTTLESSSFTSLSSLVSSSLKAIESRAELREKFRHFVSVQFPEKKKEYERKTEEEYEKRMEIFHEN